MAEGEGFARGAGGAGCRRGAHGGQLRLPDGALSPELLKHAKAAGVDVVAHQRDAMEPVKAAAEEKAAKKRAKEMKRARKQQFTKPRSMTF